MFGIETLEVVIGLIFIYLLLSLLATTINEILMQWIYSRSKNLRIALHTMLDDDTEVLGSAFFRHPLIKKLKKRSIRDFPAYISEEYFVKVMIELLCRDGPATLDAVRDGVDALPASSTRQVLLTFIRDARGDIERFKRDLELWYQEMMNQATGWYKRRVQQVLFGLGLFLSIAFNANTFQMAYHISKDPEVRGEIISQAYEYINREGGSLNRDKSPGSLQRQVEELIQEDIHSASATLGMGWHTVRRAEWKSWNGWDYFKMLAGWTVTALAITLGAPFWFDLLKHLMNIRSATKKPSAKKSNNYI